MFCALALRSGPHRAAGATPNQGPGFTQTHFCPAEILLDKVTSKITLSLYKHNQNLTKTCTETQAAHTFINLEYITGLMEAAADKLQAGGLSYGRFAHWQTSLHLHKALTAAAAAGSAESLGLRSSLASDPYQCTLTV